MRKLTFILILTALVLFAVCEKSFAAKQKGVEIVIGKHTDDLENFAASELQSYLQKLFGLSAEIVKSPTPNSNCLFVLGQQQNNPSIAKALQGKSLELSDQGFYLKKTSIDNKPAMVIAGGSGKAVMWGVYELVERYGVRYLLHGDVLPKDAGEFSLPRIDKVFEPVLRVREWAVINDQAWSPEAWPIKDYRLVLGQLAKLKFNRILLQCWPWRPFLDLEIKGIKKRFATLWFDYRYPITDDMPGRFLFGNEKEWWNPDLPVRGTSYEEFSAAGEKFCHDLIALGHSLGMESCFNNIGGVLSFPKEFAPVIPGARTVHQLQSLMVGPGPEVRPDDEEMLEISATVIKAMVDTFPDADLYHFSTLEFRSWIEQYEWAWQELDKKYHISEVMSLNEPVEKASKRVQSYGGAERSINQVKGDLVSLYYYDRLLSEAFGKTKKPNARIVMSQFAQELFPILHLVFPKDYETHIFVEYNASLVLAQREVLRDVASDKVTTLFQLTLHDDNVGILPQLSTNSLHELLTDIRGYGWEGFSTRYWQISDHDTCVAYVAKAAWDNDVTPQAVAADQIRMVCGEKAVGPMLEALEQLQKNTIQLEGNEIWNTFPVPGMMMKNYKPDSFSDALARARDSYKQSLALVRKVPKISSPQGQAYVDYWINRFEFGIGYLDTVEALCKAAALEQAADKAKEAGDMKAYRMKLTEAARQVKVAEVTAYKAIETFARVAKDRSDAGAVAIMSEYVYRALKEKVRELKEKAR